MPLLLFEDFMTKQKRVRYEVSEQKQKNVSTDLL